MTASTRLRAVASSAEHLLSDTDNHEIQVSGLTIVFPNRSWFYLWKTERRGEYRCAAVGIPTDVISAG